jgi:hypothetical protein
MASLEGWWAAFGLVWKVGVFGRWILSGLCASGDGLATVAYVMAVLVGGLWARDVVNVRRVLTSCRFSAVVVCICPIFWFWALRALVTLVSIELIFSCTMLICLVSWEIWLCSRPWDWLLNSLSRLVSAVSALSNPGTEREFSPNMFFASRWALFSESARFSRDCWCDRVVGVPAIVCGSSSILICSSCWLLKGESSLNDRGDSGVLAGRALSGMELVCLVLEYGTALLFVLLGLLLREFWLILCAGSLGWIIVKFWGGGMGFKRSLIVSSLSLVHWNYRGNFGQNGRTRPRSDDVEKQLYLDI